MSFEDGQIKCCVCNAILFEDDDKVFCPICGAPHHRECYNSLGHCACDEFHGTQKQYDIVEEKRREAREEELKKPRQEFKDNDNTATARNFKELTVCENCGTKYPAIMNRCPRCSTYNAAQTPPPYTVFPFDLLGGVPAETDLGEGVTAKEASRFVISNTHRYIPKFAEFKFGKKASWNWVAFLFPSVWFLSRKMYGLGVLFTAVLTALSLMGAPLLSAISTFMPDGLKPDELSAFLMNNLDSIGAVPIILALISSVGILLVRILIAVFGDIIYRNHTINSVLEIKSDSDLDFDEGCRKRGGIAIFAMLIGLLAVQYLPSIIFMLL